LKKGTLRFKSFKVQKPSRPTIMKRLLRKVSALILMQIKILQKKTATFSNVLITIATFRNVQNY
jgi:hypothetical protein